MSVQIPSDPIDDLLYYLRGFASRIALQFMDQQVIVSGGNMSDPNDIVTTRLYYEKLETEPTPRRRVAQQKRRAEERSHRQLVEKAVLICASVLAN